MQSRPFYSPTPASLKSEWWTPRLAWPLLAATVLRLALLMIAVFRGGTRALFDPDTVSYLEPGRNLLLHGRFIAGGVPDLFRTPGYPLFLAITSLAGFPAAAVANVLLSVFSTYLVWRIGRTVFNDNRIALCAAWLFAFEPISVTYSVLLISDALFLAIFLLSMERMAVFLRERRLRVLVASGLWLAAATYVRPVSYYLPAALALGLLVVLARVPAMRWKAPAMLLISVLPWLASWQIRNWVETGYKGFSSAAEVALYFFDVPYVTARAEHRSHASLYVEFDQVDFITLWEDSSGQLYLSQPYLALYPEQAGWSQAQRIAFMHAEILRIIRAHFGVYLRTCLTSAFRIVFELGAGNIDHLLYPGNSGHAAALAADAGLPSWLALLAKASIWVVAEKAGFAIALIGLYLFAARGVIRGGMHNACLWLLLGTSLYFIIVPAAALPSGLSRYRLPVMPVICIFAAAGVVRAKPIIRTERNIPSKHKDESEYVQHEKSAMLP